MAAVLHCKQLLRGSELYIYIIVTQQHTYYSDAVTGVVSKITD